MHPPTINELEIKTQVYWNLSKAYNGRAEKPITAEYLFRRVNAVLLACDSNRPLAQRLTQLRDTVIKGPEFEDAIELTANR